ncbi:hypothetical protein LTR53_007267 [Teratosphaeriaceae sp. CCFEE 6253]|nr:hypothetical protein LTR53_007267 [Teratosphaeriaceae sp. CCFEE 6253]
MAAPPFKVKAVYDYASEHDDDLKFPMGQVINVTELEGDDWYVGQYTDGQGAKQEGLFPSNFVERYEPSVPTRPTRAARPKSTVIAPPPAPEEDEREEEENEPPSLPVLSKPQPPPIEAPAVERREEAVRSPASAVSQKPPPARAEPPPAPKPAPAEPVPEVVNAAKPPPPVAPKSNAFKDRIAAFNSASASPIAPITPSGRGPAKNEYIKKPFVAPPPSRNAYIPPVQKVEPVHKPYIREEDPEIRHRQEEDHAAAEAAGLTCDAPSNVNAPGGAGEEEDAPKPMSLKERMAMLQKEQEAQRARHAEPPARKERKAPPQKPAASMERAVPPPTPAHQEEDEEAELERVPTQRQSLDVHRERPRVPSAQTRPAEPLPVAPEHEDLSGGEEADQSGAGDMTEDDAATIGGHDSASISDKQFEPPLPRAVAVPTREADAGDAGETAADPEQGEEEEEEMDEEEQRKQRLRERMARLAGGQQGGGPFNPFGMPPAVGGSAPKKRIPTRERQATEDDGPTSMQQQMPQMVAIPGMGGAPLPPRREKSPDPETPARRSATEPARGDEDDEEPSPPPRRSTAMERGAPTPPRQPEDRSAAPSVPKDRPVPAPPTQERALPPASADTARPVPRPPPVESRPVPPPPARDAAPLSPGPGSESDDEMSSHAKHSSAELSGYEAPMPLPIRTGAPPVPPPRSPDVKRTSSYFNEPSSATSEKRMSRMPPPVPGTPQSPVGSPRPPPPPPPTAAPPSRQDHAPPVPSALAGDERGESDYEGDYDTDIASGATHKEALKSHARDPSLDDSTTADDFTPPGSATRPVPAPPPQAAPRAVPPPPPPGQPRPSIDTPRAPPPVPPPTRAAAEDGDYDPYNYAGGSRDPPPIPGAIPMNAPPIPPDPALETEQAEDSSADEVPNSATLGRKSMDRAPPPPPLTERAPPMPPAPAPLQAPLPPLQGPPPIRALPRQSLDVARAGSVRRSADQARPSGEHSGQIAQDIDLAHGTQWWTAVHPLPPSLQPRNGVDLLSESEESQKSRRGGRTTLSKDIYVLYMDYSQTVLTAQYDKADPADVTLEQRHEPPPPKLRQDQLEAYWQRFGAQIAHAASAAGHSKEKNNAVGDGSPGALPLELIRGLKADALLPVGAKAYGALVYANLANASTMQSDEIRAGDIVTLRAAKFEGHHGAIKSKYKVDYGAQHVGVVEEWDGTRRSVRMWEQGRERKGGVRGEKLRLGDLRSGEVRVWRVVGREWVGWSE